MTMTTRRRFVFVAVHALLLASQSSAFTRGAAADILRSGSQSPSRPAQGEGAEVPQMDREAAPSRGGQARTNEGGGGGGDSPPPGGDPAAKSLLGYGLIAMLGAMLVCVYRDAAREIGNSGTGDWLRPLSRSATAAGSWREGGEEVELEMPIYGSVREGGVEEGPQENES